MVVVKNADGSNVVAIKADAAISIEKSEMRRRTNLFFMVNGKAIGVTTVDAADADKLAGVRQAYEDYRDKILTAMMADSNNLETIVIGDVGAAWDEAHPVLVPSPEVEDVVDTPETDAITEEVGTDTPETTDQDVVAEESAAGAADAE